RLDIPYQGSVSEYYLSRRTIRNVSLTHPHPVCIVWELQRFDTGSYSFGLAQSRRFTGCGRLFPFWSSGPRSFHRTCYSRWRYSAQ
ncbi:hypothetical protein FRC11_000742, partial [Ceratobasidium sp. 423]